MKTYNDLWNQLCSKEHLYNAFVRARKRKTKKLYVQEFESNLEENISLLRVELLFHSYRPQPLTTFVIRDPKTRVISKSAFRDRVVHHAIVLLLEPLFDKSFIFDSYANRKGKGTLKALQRFNYFKCKHPYGCVLKADIRHYFDEVDHGKLLAILKKRIKDVRVMFLLNILVNHYHKSPGRGMPLGNLTSQFFANVYLNELDHFVKEELHVKYYIRYVDDFVIFSKDQQLLEKDIHFKIDAFLHAQLGLSLNPQKCTVRKIKQGISFIGFRIFPLHQLLKKVNILRMHKRLLIFRELYDKELMTYDTVYSSLQGWCGYARHGCTYKLRKKLCAKLEVLFPGEVSSCTVNSLLRDEGSAYVYPL